MNKTVVLIIASNGYQPVEYGRTKETIEKAGIAVITASDALGIAISSGDKTAQVDMLVQKIDPEKYAGIFIIGGPGALEHLDNMSTHDVMRKAAQLSKPYGAICISPRILAKIGLLKGKKATGWDADQELSKIFGANGVTLVPNDVVVDGTVVTAAGPVAAQKFGEAIISVV